MPALRIGRGDGVDGGDDDEHEQDAVAVAAARAESRVESRSASEHARRPERRRAPRGAPFVTSMNRIRLSRRDEPAFEPCPASFACGGAELLQLDAAAGLLELLLELVGLVALDALLDGLRRLVDERLGLLEAEAGRRADDLDDLDLLVAGCGEDDVDRRGLLLGRGARRRRRRAGAAAATAVADTPNSSSSALMRSASSSTEMPLSSSIQSWVLVAMFVSPWWSLRRARR